MPRQKRSFLERLTGSVNAEEAEVVEQKRVKPVSRQTEEQNDNEEWMEDEEGQLTLDVYQTPDDLVVQSFIAGVRLDELDVSITQDMLTIKGKRARTEEVPNEDYYYQELYWGSFARSVLLPQEVDVDEAQATLKNGLLTIRLRKRDKDRIQKLRVKHE